MVRLRTKGIDFKLFIGFFLVTFTMSILNINQSSLLSLNFITGSFGNIGGVIVASFLFNCFSEKTEFIDRSIISLAAGTGLFVYEFLQKWIPLRTFDKNDLLGSFIGVIFAILINGIVIITIKFTEFRKARKTEH